MPFEDQVIPPEICCINERCDHMLMTHDDKTEACDMCSCVEFQPPASFRPKWIPNKERTTIYEAICRPCFKNLFPQEKAPPLDWEEQECSKCSELTICSRVSEYYIKTKMITA